MFVQFPCGERQTQLGAGHELHLYLTFVPGQLGHVSSRQQLTACAGVAVTRTSPRPASTVWPSLRRNVRRSVSLSAIVFTSLSVSDARAFRVDRPGFLRKGERVSLTGCAISEPMDRLDRGGDSPLDDDTGRVNAEAIREDRVPECP